METQSLVVLIVAFGGWIFAALQAWLSYSERRHSRRDQHLFEALSWFSGGTQKRNIGISVVEGYWAEIPHLRRILVTLLVNQAIYLLTQSEQYDSSHERNNLCRIMRLLLNFTNLKEGSPHQHKWLVEALDQRIKGKCKKGVNIGMDNLKNWKNRLGKVTTGLDDIPCNAQGADINEALSR